MTCVHACRVMAAIVLLGLAAPPAAAATLRTIALTGDVAPAPDPNWVQTSLPDGAEFGTFRGQTINNSGQVAFRTRLTGNGVSSANNIAIVGPTGIVARSGTFSVLAFLEDFDDAEITDLSAPALSDTGAVAFFASGRRLGIERSLLGTTGPPSTRTTSEGLFAPGTNGARFSSFVNFAFAAPAMSGSGDLVFSSGLASGDTTIANNRGIFTLSDLVLRSGTPVPGAGGGVYTNFFTPTINDSGEVAFVGTVSGGLIVATPSTVIAQTGEVAQGTGGAVFSSLSNPDINNAEEVAFQGNVTGSGVTGANSQGIFTTSGVVVREGEVAPGTGGAVYTGIGAPSLNNEGEIAFLSGLSGAGVTAANNLALFLLDAVGAPTLLVREGDVLDLGNGDERTIQRLSFFDDSLNDHGDVVFSADFTTGGQGIFVLEAGELAPVPLPLSGALLLAGLGGLGLFRRRS